MKKLAGVLLVFLLIGCNSEDKKGKEKVEVKQNEPQEQIVPSDIVLGHYSFIEIGVKNSIQESIQFYSILGFKEVPNQFEDTSMMMMTDNNLKIVLNKVSIAPAMIVYLNEDLNALKAELTQDQVLFREPGDFIEIKSPNGARIAVLERDTAGLFHTNAPTFMDLMETGRLSDPSSFPNPNMGVFAEFSHQVDDVKAAMRWWAKLGLIGQGVIEYEGSKFAILMDKLNVVGVHNKGQQHNWIGSAITYFATDQEIRIESLKQKIPAESFNESEKLGPGNAVLKTPEGNLIFLFKL